MTFLKTYRLSPLIIVISLLLSNCKKDSQTDPVSILKGVYKSKAYFNLYDIQMFTAKGQVQDPALLSDFIKRRDFDFTSGETEPLDSEMGAINFIGNGTATIDLPNNNGILIPTKFTITDKTSSSFILKQNDIYKNSLQQSDSRIVQLLDISNLVEQTVNCQSSPAGPTKCDYIRRLPFVLSNNTLHLSYYSIAIYSEQPGLTQKASITDAPGIFNNGVTKRLMPGDTLVVQTKYLEFLKN